MEKMYEKLFDAVNEGRQIILDAERHIWRNPEPGFREWETHKYLKKLYEDMGYEVHEVGEIPGFYIDIDTGRPGPKIGVFAEMDALIIPEHPEADEKWHAVHACGHHAQSAAMLGIGMAFKDKASLEGLSGSIRLMAVPAEEVIEMGWRLSLMEQGVLEFYGGKQEFMRRGILDDVDMAIMVHGGSAPFSLNTGCTGGIFKNYTFLGKATHAAGPWQCRNALYAANSAMTAANALRETFSELNKTRYHGIITYGGEAMNVIPDVVKMECQVRGLTMKNILETNEKINRAYAGSAAALGCKLIINDHFGYAPRIENKDLQSAFLEGAHLLFNDDEIKTGLPPAPGNTDMGDVSMVMPVCHAFVGGGKGGGHSVDYQLANPELACVTCAKLQSATLAILMKNGAERAKEVLANYTPEFPSIKEYIEYTKKINFNDQAVIYNEDGSITLKIKNENLQ